MLICLEINTAIHHQSIQAYSYRRVDCGRYINTVSALWFQVEVVWFSTQKVTISNHKPATYLRGSLLLSTSHNVKHLVIIDSSKWPHNIFKHFIPNSSHRCQFQILFLQQPFEKQFFFYHFFRKIIFVFENMRNKTT